jgi:hypothetical protein
MVTGAMPELLRDAARLENPGGGALQSSSSVLESLSIPLDDPSLMPDSLRASYFFAFDHLMDQGVVSRHVRGLKPFKVVRAPNYRLSWPYYYPPEGGALPSLERSDNEGVWGLLYIATKVDFSLLERSLNVPNRYHRRVINTLDRGDRRLTAFTYVLSLSDDDESNPAPGHLARMTAAAADRGLPIEWVKYLDSCGQKAQGA